MNDEEIITKLKKLVLEGKEIEKKLWHYSNTFSVVENNRNSNHDIIRWSNICLNLLKLRFGPDSQYHKEFERHCKPTNGVFYRDEISRSIGALEYIIDSLENGLIEDMFYKREVELLTDLLEQAYEFFKSNFKLASGIYGRIVLETTVKEFASKNGIEEDKFDQAIIKLRQSNLISKPFENALRSNYEIGSWAAHGREEFEKLSDNQKKEFLDFIRDKVLTL